jgi:hypothetical protein
MNCWTINKLLLHLLLMGVPIISRAQMPPIVEFTGQDEIEIRCGEEVEVSLSFLIPDDYYIQAHKLKNEYFLPTVLNLNQQEEIEVGEIRYPASIDYKYNDEEEPLEIFTKEIVFDIPMKVGKAYAGGADMTLTGSLYYQACSRSKCYYPRDLDFALKIKVIP